MTVVLDIWTGEHSENHVARYIGPLETLLPQIVSEVRTGFLVNIRADTDFGPEEAFDERLGVGVVPDRSAIALAMAAPAMHAALGPLVMAARSQADHWAKQAALCSDVAVEEEYRARAARWKAGADAGEAAIAKAEGRAP